MKKLFLFLFSIIFMGSMAFCQTTILSEDFESGTPPTGWTTSASTPSVGWVFGNSLGSSFFAIPAHTRYACSNDDANDDNSTTANVADMDFLISPVMDLTAYSATGVALTFSYIQPGNYGSSGTVEVTTNGGSSWTVLTVLTNGSSWAETTMDLSSYTSSSTVQIGFHHNDGGNWADGFGVDDVVIFEVPAMDATVSTVSGNTYQLTGNHTVTGDVSNLGYTTMTSFDLTYTVNGGGSVTQNFSGVSVGLNGSYTYSFTTPVNMPVSDTYVLDVTIGNINGGAVTDADASNDMLATTINTLSIKPVKFGLLTDHTGAWCGFCPDGAVVMDGILQAQSNMIGVAIHNSDAMAIADGETINTTYISGYPTGMVDMFLFDGESEVAMSRGDWDAKSQERLAHVVPAAVSITSSTFDNTTRAIDVTIQVDFFGPASGEFRVNAWVVEDGVTGTGTGYDQTNYFDGTAGHPYQGAGDPIVGYVHDHTLRQMMGGAWGTSGVISGTPKSGDTFTQTYSWTLPAGMDDSKIKIVGMVQKYNSTDINDRAILNSVEADLGSVLLERDDLNAEVLGVYPNPFSNTVTIEFALQNNNEVNIGVYDLFGKQIRSLLSGGMNTGIHSVQWDGTTQAGMNAVNGVYIVVVESGGQRTAQKVVLTR